MNDEAPLPRFRKPPVSEVALGVQFSAVLNPVHLGLYYQRVKTRFPKIQMQSPVLPVFETFGTGGLPGPQFAFTHGMQPRMWFLSDDDNFLIQLQSDRLLVNWRSGPLPLLIPISMQYRRSLPTRSTGYNHSRATKT
jgi:uncharacterized protein (TIGR04255 family)